MPDNKLAQEAMNVTLYNWGLHGWVVYTIVGLLIGLMSHRYAVHCTLYSKQVICIENKKPVATKHK